MNGLVIGKFYPPHKGHMYLIDTAIANCQNLHIIICALPEENPNGTIRYRWLKEMYNTCTVYIIDNYDTIYNDDSQYWADDS